MCCNFTQKYIRANHLTKRVEDNNVNEDSEYLNSRFLIGYHLPNGYTDSNSIILSWTWVTTKWTSFPSRKYIPFKVLKSWHTRCKLIQHNWVFHWKWCFKKEQIFVGFQSWKDFKGIFWELISWRLNSSSSLISLSSTCSQKSGFYCLKWSHSPSLPTISCVTFAF